MRGVCAAQRCALSIQEVFEWDGLGPRVGVVVGSHPRLVRAVIGVDSGGLIQLLRHPNRRLRKAQTFSVQSSGWRASATRASKTEDAAVSALPPTVRTSPRSRSTAQGLPRSRGGSSRHCAETCLVVRVGGWVKLGEWEEQRCEGEKSRPIKDNQHRQPDRSFRGRVYRRGPPGLS